MKQPSMQIHIVQRTLEFASFETTDQTYKILISYSKKHSFFAPKFICLNGPTLSPSPSFLVKFPFIGLLKNFHSNCHKWEALTTFSFSENTLESQKVISHVVKEGLGFRILLSGLTGLGFRFDRT